jgi:DNA mismatch endonuclease (patch repair protein)
MDEPTDRDKPRPFQDGSGFYTTSARSRLMGRIRGRNTKPEMRLRKALWALGFRYRLHAKHLPGRPDLAFPKYKVAVFIDGEFWHGYQWETRREGIKTNRDYWIPKIERNMARDREHDRALEAAGWTVLRFWAKQVEQDPEACLTQIAAHLGYYRYWE